MRKGFRKNDAAERAAFGARIRAERERLGITQMDLAYAARVSLSTLCKAELGVHMPQPRTRAAIEDALAAAAERRESK